VSPSTKKTVQAVLLLAVALVAYAWREGWFGNAPTTSSGGAGSGAGTGAPSSERPPGRGTRYDPASPEPKDAIPGGSLAAHEGVDGGHTLARHAGRTLDDLRRRLASDNLREVSTFVDAAAADRFVGQALYDRRADVARWLASGPSGNEAFPSRLRVPAGNVLRRGASDVTAGRTVQVVLAPSRRFSQGFRIVTAYVTLP
jgi:hypothetical protein